MTVGGEETVVGLAIAGSEPDPGDQVAHGGGRGADVGGDGAGGDVEAEQDADEGLPGAQLGVADQRQTSTPSSRTMDTDTITARSPFS